MSSKKSRKTSISPPPPAPTPVYRRKRVRLAIVFVPVAILLAVALVLVLAPQWIFPPPPADDTGPINPPGALPGPYGIQGSLSFGYSGPSLFGSMNFSNLQCPPQVANTSIFTCNLMLINGSHSARNVTAASTQGRKPYTLTSMTKNPPWQVDAQAQMPVGLTFTIWSGATAGSYPLDLNLTVQ